MKKVLLLSMPFGALERQALGLSLFKTRLVEEGIPCDVRYLTFPFADLIGVEEYCWLSTDLPHTAFAGDWIFTRCLYGPNPRAQAGYIREVLQGIWRLDDRSVARVLRAEALAPPFLDHCLQVIPWDDYAVVGFTSTFEQNVASLALARRVKAEHPQVTIVFGGANWEGEMGLELHRCFPFVDYACSGEADESFPVLVRGVLAGRPKGKVRTTVAGLIHRSGAESHLTPRPDPIRDLDALPIPDYSDYFHAFEHSSAAHFVVPTLLFESARGCWWGAKQPCMFCGLNGATMRFRAKTAARALREIQYLVRRWRIDWVQAVDNVVPMDYFRDFFPSLAHAEWPVRLFYEIRANLRRRQVQILRAAGVRHVQPGIESLNNHVLDLMRKGTTALDNIQVLKWCREYGVQADYNLLYGFPGETIEDYQELFRILPAVRFLNPPTACGPVRLDRFSVYFQEARARGLVKVRPMLPYRYLYPFGEESLRRIAYYYDYELAPGASLPDCWAALVRWVEEWKARPETGTLQAFHRPDGTVALLDSRSQATRASVVLRGIDKAVYDYCDCARSLAAICEHLARTFPLVALRRDQVQSFLDALVAHRYMLHDGGRYLSLALHSQPVELASHQGLPEQMPARTESV